MVGGQISYQKEIWQKIEDQECGKKRTKASTVRFYNYVTKQYQYVTNERLENARRQKRKNKNNNNNNNNNRNNNNNNSNN